VQTLVTAEGVELPASPWPEVLDHGAGLDLEAWHEHLSEGTAAPLAAPPSPAAPEQDKTLTCDPYAFHYAGHAPAWPSSSSAQLSVPPVDNDCDGEFNEDPYDGHDNDGDGAVDEDPGWLFDCFISWSSSDPELGELSAVDEPAIIALVRLCWPSRSFLGFAAAPGDDEWLTGFVRIAPPGGGVALVGRGWDAVGYTLSHYVPVTLTVEILESGTPLSDGTWFAREVSLTAATEGGSGAVTVTATIDDAPYELGTTFGVEGEHSIEVTANDEGGQSVAATATFGVDLTPPAFSDLEPSPGSLLAS